MLAGTEEISDDAETDKFQEKPPNIGIKVESFIVEENKVDEQFKGEKGFSNPLFDSTPPKEPILEVPGIEVGEAKDAVEERKEPDAQGGFDNMLYGIDLPLSMSANIKEDISTLGISNPLAISEPTEKGVNLTFLKSATVSMRHVALLSICINIRQIQIIYIQSHYSL